jgi:hypothetical protein
MDKEFPTVVRAVLSRNATLIQHKLRHVSYTSDCILSACTLLVYYLLVMSSLTNPKESEEQDFTTELLRSVRLQ